ncbi:unnamed protein product, partial [Rotaria sp. Silwood2]
MFEKHINDEIDNALKYYKSRQGAASITTYIFAIWTLKNTQHYNAMRGIDAARAYLLMPHVGQVIAIFRLLVEVGTGEGKSVVLAITACVFALTGVDVNCSCYSEVLSSRDKNDFVSVFRTLGIEDRIEYGTFNKLCEQLLNKQCNVRENVRHMIVANQSSLTAADTSARLRPKVLLLVDEVDVFLSDKYYGGTYIPSVHLKHPYIKALLDSIWKTKTLRSLTNVKALPAYNNCATQYTTIGKVTLLTRAFGRGTDFICRNQQLLANGGIHVLQTFFSEEISEEYQIMGRGPRQGDQGSYRMILLDKDLEWVLGASWKVDLSKIIGTTLYTNLDKNRSIRYESKCGAKELGIELCKAEHKASKEFMQALATGNITAVKIFKKKQNQGANLITTPSL